MVSIEASISLKRTVSCQQKRTSLETSGIGALPIGRFSVPGMSAVDQTRSFPDG